MLGNLILRNYIWAFLIFILLVISTMAKDLLIWNEGNSFIEAFSHKKVIHYIVYLWVYSICAIALFGGRYIYHQLRGEKCRPIRKITAPYIFILLFGVAFFITDAVVNRFYG